MSHSPLSAGQLDRRIRIEQKSVARDASFGSEVVTWVTLATLWAKVAEVVDTRPGGGEKPSQDVQVLTRRQTVLIRYRSDVTAAMRVALNDRGRTLQIVAIAEVGRREGLELTCEDYSA